MTPTLTHLRGLAEKAHANDEMWWDDPKEWMRASQIMWIDELDAAYLAAIAPSTVLALIRIIEGMRGGLDHLDRELNKGQLLEPNGPNHTFIRQLLAQADLEIEAIK